MIKKYKVEVDCANCAAKMEEAIKKLEKVNNATVNFMTQKMTIDADVEDMDAFMDIVEKECKKVEPDCEIYR
ncbi:MAG: cation transporter [Eubacterium sp.]|nr:cation transporter [Eubacterium sp.]